MPPAGFTSGGDIVVSKGSGGSYSLLSSEERSKEAQPKADIFILGGTSPPDPPAYFSVSDV